MSHPLLSTKLQTFTVIHWLVDRIKYLVAKNPNISLGSRQPLPLI